MKVDPTEIPLMNKWNDNPKPDWKKMLGKRAFIGQQSNGAFYIRIENRVRHRYCYDRNDFTEEERLRVSESTTSSRQIKFKPDEVDALIDALITVKELIATNKPMSSIINRGK